MNENPLNCIFLGLNLKNPLVLASGILGTSVELMTRCAIEGAGVITSKSCGLEPRSGHPNPCTLDWGYGVINAIGLTNPGIEEEVQVLQLTLSKLNPLSVPLFASVFAPTVRQYGEVVRKITDANPALIELNISCPNVADEFGTPFAGSPESAANVTRAARQATHLPISVKLAPNVPNIARIARAVADAGADAITAINTMPGMLIDAYAGKAILSHRGGGISGPAIKPIALRCVAEIAAAVDLPIIGTGGVMNGLDAAEMIMAGASLVGVGSAAWTYGVSVFEKINQELIAFMQAEDYGNIESMRGKAL